MTKKQKNILLDKTEEFTETVEKVLSGKEYDDFVFELFTFIVKFCFARMKDTGSKK